MIVEIKKELAKIVADTLQRKAKIHTSKFNEATANRAQRDLEVAIYHISDNWVRTNKGTYTRNYRYYIEVSCKNLKTDDEIQGLVDTLCYSLLAASIFQKEIIIEKIDNLGINDESIWSYRININVPVLTNTDTGECQDVKPFTFDSVQLNVSPSFSKPLIED